MPQKAKIQCGVCFPSCVVRIIISYRIWRKLFSKIVLKSAEMIIFFWISQSVSYFMGILHFLGLTWLILIIFKLFILLIIKFKVFLFSGIFHSPFQLSLNKFFTQTFYLPVNPVCSFSQECRKLQVKKLKTVVISGNKQGVQLEKKKEYCNRIEILQWK